jgi:hypothetical protein
VGGDSDSSALTQESGDEGGVAETPRESVVTGTDAGTEYAEDEDTEMREPSPGSYFCCSMAIFIIFITFIQRARNPRDRREDDHQREGGEGAVERRLAGLQRVARRRRNVRFFAHNLFVSLSLVGSTCASRFLLSTLISCIAKSS